MKKWEEVKKYIKKEERLEFRPYITLRFSIKPVGYRLTFKRKAAIIASLPTYLLPLEREMFKRII